MALPMQTVVYNSAGIAIDRKSVILKLPEIEYLLLNFMALENQLAWYWLVEP